MYRINCSYEKNLHTKIFSTGVSFVSFPTYFISVRCIFLFFLKRSWNSESSFNSIIFSIILHIEVVSFYKFKRFEYYLNREIFTIFGLKILSNIECTWTFYYLITLTQQQLVDYKIPKEVQLPALVILHHGECEQKLHALILASPFYDRTAQRTVVTHAQLQGFRCRTSSHSDQTIISLLTLAFRKCFKQFAHICFSNYI